MRIVREYLLNIFDIRKFSIHDGPGIRTVVFLKGCSLRCDWCANPEGIRSKPDLAHFRKKCVLCGRCVLSCKHGLILVSEKGWSVDRKRCTCCGDCERVCMQNAISIIGRMVSESEILLKVKEDMLFYENSGGGGMTLSGGEPLVQHEASYSLLKKCKGLGIGTALETNGFADSTVFRRFEDVVDHLLFDVKAVDSKLHMHYTGVGNKIILQNLRFAAEHFAHVIIRFPYVPNYNDRQVFEIFKLAKKIGVEEVDILPYHELGSYKYTAIGDSYNIESNTKLDAAEMESLVEHARLMNITVTVDG